MLFSVVLGLGSVTTAQSVLASFLSAFYHTFGEEREEFRYQTQYYGAAFYLGLAGLVATCLALISILGEESHAKHYVVIY